MLIPNIGYSLYYWSVMALIFMLPLYVFKKLC